MDIYIRNAKRAKEIEPSDWLSERAKELYRFYRDEMYKTGILRTLDPPLIELLADTKARLEEVTKQLESEGVMVDCKRAGKKKNPIYHLRANYMHTYLDISKKLGLFGNSRLIDPIE